MNTDNSILAVTDDVKQCIKIISDHMMSLRPRGEIEYYPYWENDVFYRTRSKGRIHVNLKKLYPNSKPGDVVYAQTLIRACADYNAVLHVWDDVKLSLNGEEIYDRHCCENYDDTEGASINVHLKKGDNSLSFKCRCTGENFKFSFMVSVPYYKWWAKDYIFNSRAVSPLEYFCGEDGLAISKLCTEEEAFDGEYIFPPKPVETTTVDFSRFYQDSGGDIAYALTYALDDGSISIDPHSRMQLIINGERVPHDAAVNVKKGDEILIKSLRSDNWGFSYLQTDIVGIPFLKSSRKANDKFLLIGAFGASDTFELKHGPEFGINITEPYTDNDWHRVFWRLNEDNVYLRIYMDTSFFSQWFYALMVGQYGMLDAADALCSSELKQYFYDSMSNMAEFYDYCRYDLDTFKTANFLHNIIETDFDNIGSMCMNFAELHKINPNSKARYVMEKLFNKAEANIPKYSDGAHHRPENPWQPGTMWADDTYMITPFLVRMGLINNDDYYYNEVVRQFRGFHSRLYMETEGIYSHIYFTKEACANLVPWGRGNGWIFNSLSDVLRYIPEHIEGRDELMDMFIAFAYALKNYQDADGLWHQVLNIPESYSETSSTAMFMLGMCRGVNNGWLLRDDFEGAIDKAYRGLIKHKIDKTGNVFDVCRGSSCSMEAKYYMQLGTIDNDDHGTGIILSAFSEYLKMKEC